MTFDIRRTSVFQDRGYRYRTDSSMLINVILQRLFYRITLHVRMRLNIGSG